MINQYVSKYDTPHRLHLETTKHCNMRCEHCYANSDSTYTHYPKEELFDIILKSRKKGIRRITFTGGEFLTRPDHKEIIEFALRIGFTNIYFISNGLAISKELLKWIAKVRVKYYLINFIKNFFEKDYRPVTFGIGISLDGFASFGKIRKTNSGKPIDYKVILRNIELATRYGIYITVNTVISNKNTALELFEIYQKIIELNVDRWQVDQLFLSGRSVDNSNIEDYRTWINIAKDNYKKIISHYINNPSIVKKLDLSIVQLFRKGILTHGLNISNDGLSHPCDYQFGSIIVENVSKVRFCPSLRFDSDEIFDLKNKDISAENYEKNYKFINFSSLKIDDLPCKNCRYKLISHGGCRANSYSYFNLINFIDPICCEFSPFFEKEIVSPLPKKIQKQYNLGIYEKGSIPSELLIKVKGIN